MKSPFPGMDPFIEAEALWEGFHDRLIGRIDEALARILPPGYIIDIASRSYVVLVESEGKKKRLAKPDVTITERPSRKRPRKKNGGVAVAELPEVVESVQMQAFIAEEFREIFLEIYAQREERQLVTSIEVLSPSNKRPDTEGWIQYKRKRQAMLLGRANYIELDLLRGGDKHPMLTDWPDYPYTLLVSRAIDAPYCRVFRGDFLRRLPVIPVPLFDPDLDLQLDLQPLIDTIYELGRYHEEIDYSRRLTPALTDAESGAVRDLLKNHSSRSSRKDRKE
jgi:hypothetical protein